MNNHYAPLSFNAMLAVCVGLCGCPFRFLLFYFLCGAIIQSFFVVENFFKKDLVYKVIVFTFALQI